ncbi:MAG TPA: hypothetical protein DCX54_08010 [Flavobacteriales bacterium]|nr:hypothetical protein [Flavobacteriales bacterium]
MLGASGAEIHPTPDPADPAKIYIPKDLDDVFIELRKMLPQDVQTKMKNGTEQEMIEYHFSLGMWMRNHWGLWQKSRLAKYFHGIGVQHPDDMSGIIIKSFWRHLNNKPVQLEKQVAYYQEYWKYNIPPEDAVSPADGSPINFISAHPCKDMNVSEHCLEHLGVSKSDGTPWAYQYGKGVYEPDKAEKESILGQAQRLGIIKK